MCSVLLRSCSMQLEQIQNNGLLMQLKACRKYHLESFNKSPVPVKHNRDSIAEEEKFWSAVSDISAIHPNLAASAWRKPSGSCETMAGETLPLLLWLLTEATNKEELSGLHSHTTAPLSCAKKSPVMFECKRVMWSAPIPWCPAKKNNKTQKQCFGK